VSVGQGGFREGVFGGEELFVFAETIKASATFRLIGGSGRTAGRYTTTARAFISPAAYVGPLPEPRAESASPAGLLKGHM
jgi:hypothetical protein